MAVLSAPSCLLETRPLAVFDKAVPDDGRPMQRQKLSPGDDDQCQVATAG
jgi:hypothetical protein